MQENTVTREEQEKLLIEMMEADERDGLYDDPAATTPDEDLLLMRYKAIWEQVGYNHRRARRIFDKTYGMPTFTQQLYSRIAQKNQLK
jgi:hypothetical protein